MEEFTVKMEYDRSTKRTYRFKERSEPIKIGTQYVQKSAFTKQPRVIEVTVKVKE